MFKKTDNRLLQLLCYGMLVRLRPRQLTKVYIVRIKWITGEHMIERKKIILGFAGVTAAAVMGTAGIAAAQTPNTGAMPTSKADCTHWQDFSFKNRGQCESWWAHQVHGGNGYGNANNNSVSTNLNVDVKGNNNIVNIALNYVFGQ
jgi:hypothetical protein